MLDLIKKIKKNFNIYKDDIFVKKDQLEIDQEIYNKQF